MGVRWSKYSETLNDPCVLMVLVVAVLLPTAQCKLFLLRFAAPTGQMAMLRGQQGRRETLGYGHPDHRFLVFGRNCLDTND